MAHTKSLFTSRLCIYLPALVWARRAIQSEARERICSDCESCRRSTSSLMPVAEDIACSSSGMIRDNTTT